MTQLSVRLARAIENEDFEHLALQEAADASDALRALLQIHELFLAPIQQLEGRERFQNHPAIHALKCKLEDWLLGVLDARIAPFPPQPADIAEALRRIARRSNDTVYDWLASSADWSQLVAFLTYEGGPDGGFDDLVALAQVGIRGEPKVFLGKNYWDEMGQGSPADVHTDLHERLIAAMQLQRLPLDALPLPALYRAALNGLLATNRHLQPELLGALGLVEVQAGPRCRRVIEALTRLQAPEDAFPFYAVHAETDPIHGKEWLERVLRPLVAENASWFPRIVRGALWRDDVNARFLNDMHSRLATRELLPA